jgi:hypothetical protein
MVDEKSITVSYTLRERSLSVQAKQSVGDRFVSWRLVYKYPSSRPSLGLFTSILLLPFYKTNIESYMLAAPLSVLQKKAMDKLISIGATSLFLTLPKSDIILHNDNNDIAIV